MTNWLKWFVYKMTEKQNVRLTKWLVYKMTENSISDRQNDAAPIKVFFGCRKKGFNSWKLFQRNKEMENDSLECFSFPNFIQDSLITAFKVRSLPTEDVRWLSEVVSKLNWIWLKTLANVQTH